jgi:hypothetical protein
MNIVYFYQNYNILKIIILSILTIFSLNKSTQSSIAQHQNGCNIEVLGEISEAHLEKISNLKCKYLVLNIDSYGGEIGLSMDIAEIISSMNTTIIVNNYCISSCAEVILPSAKNIIFKNEPLIGFHGNSIMLEFLSNSIKPPGFENCTFDNAKRMREIYQKAEVNSEFWDFQLRYLRLKNLLAAPVKQSNQCPKMQMNFIHDLWFPSSISLKDDLKLKFKGEVCADNVQNCKAKIYKQLPRRSFVIDETIFQP